MIDSIIQIGEEISKGRDPWEDLICPKVKADEKGGKLRLIQVPIIFDLDTEQVKLGDPEPYDPSFRNRRNLRFINTKGGNFKSHYLCVDAAKVNGLVKSLFGKDGAEKGELQEFMEQVSGFEDRLVWKLLPQIYSLQNSFFDLLKDEKKGTVTPRSVSDQIDLSKFERLALIYVKVSAEEFGLKEDLLAIQEGYDYTLETKFLASASTSDATSSGVCYATGQRKDAIVGPGFDGRYNINKLFVQTTLNYASLFDKKNFQKNYQLNQEVRDYLNRGSSYLLDHFQVKIAGFPYVLIPRLAHHHSFSIKELEAFKKGSDLLFSYDNLEALGTEVEETKDEAIPLAWLTFLAIDSDGNYFKAPNLITDVPSFHLFAVVRALREAGKVFQNWMGMRHFNFYSVFRFIPVREGGTKNPALDLFKSILEQRAVPAKELYRVFSEYALCHYFGRYRGYANQKPQAEFEFAIKNGAYGFLTLIYALQNLGLLMETQKNDATKPSPPARQGARMTEQELFQAMQYSEPQIALFYLGRAVNQVAYAQQKKGNQKRILQKLNFNGMEARHLMRLSEDLFEKGTQYNELLDKIQWNLAEFNRRFQPRNWNMDPKEALFFVMTGYTFGLQKKEDKSEAI